MQDENVLEGETCPFCHKKELVLLEREMDVPYFGKVFLFSMSCNGCKYYKADIEPAEVHEPAKYTLEISSEEDLSIRIVKSSTATVKVPRICTIEPGPNSNGYITNVEGILNRIKSQIENQRDFSEEPEVKKQAKALLKKLGRVLWGKDKIKLIIEDPSGNSAIISEKAVKGKL